MKTNALILAIAAAASVAGAGDCTEFTYILPAGAEFEITTTGTFQNVSTLASAFAIAQSSGPIGCWCVEIRVDYDVGATHASAGVSICTGHVYAQFGGAAGSDISVSSNRIGVSLGALTAYHFESLGCYPCLDEGIAQSTAGGGAGASIMFDVSSDVTINPMGFSSPNAYVGSPSRVIRANVICATGEDPAYYAIVSDNNEYLEFTSGPVTWGSGTHGILSGFVSVTDAQHDLNNDGRFNQLDVDILDSVVGTGAATDAEYAEFDIFNDDTDTSDDGVDAEDVALFQCFIDTGLSSGIFGDGDGDGDVDCNDLSLALSQDFSGEAFPASAYNIGFDFDVDGDNDIDDLNAVADVMLETEPANQQFDGSINSFDNSAFIARFRAEDPRADLNGDGVYNFFDLSIFLTSYQSPNCL